MQFFVQNFGWIFQLLIKYYIWRLVTNLKRLLSSYYHKQVLGIRKNDGICVNTNYFSRKSNENNIILHNSVELSLFACSNESLLLSNSFLFSPLIINEKINNMSTQKQNKNV